MHWISRTLVIRKRPVLALEQERPEVQFWDVYWGVVRRDWHIAGKESRSGECEGGSRESASRGMYVKEECESRSEYL